MNSFTKSKLLRNNYIHFECFIHHVIEVTLVEVLYISPAMY